MMPDFLLLFPLAQIAALLLLAPASLAPDARLRATVALLTCLLFSVITSLLLIRLNAHSDAFTTTRLLSATLSILATSLIATPLLDRARPAGLLIGASLGGIFIVPLIFHGLVAKLPAVGGSVILYAVLIAASLLGLCGSKKLPHHPARYTAEGVRRLYAIATVRLSIGWFILSLLLIMFGVLMDAPDKPLALFPLLMSGITAALLTLLRTKARDGLRKASEAFTAGILLVMLVDLSMEMAVMCGLIAACIVLRSESLAHALKLDDPQNISGTILLPTSLGLLLPGVLNGTEFAAHAFWFFSALGIGFGMAVLIWPLTKLTVGLAAPLKE